MNRDVSSFVQSEERTGVVVVVVVEAEDGTWDGGADIV